MILALSLAMLCLCIGLFIFWPEGLGYLLAVTVVMLGYIAILALTLCFWGGLFVGFEWLFPGIIAKITPGALAEYTIFWRGALFGVLVVVVRGLLR